MSSLKTTILKNDTYVVLAMSIPLAALITSVSVIGIFSDDLYENEALNWQIQAVGQDIIDLILIVPILMTSSLILLKNRTMGLPIWGGVILYTIYTFVIYAFDVHFNKLFLFYCLTFGLAFYSFLYFSYRHLWQPTVMFQVGKTKRRIIGIYFIFIAVIFYGVWLSEVVPAMTGNTTPKILLDIKLPTNPIHVLDLAIVLPGIFMLGVLLLRNKKVGLIFTPVMLMFFILMDITIGTLSIMMQQKGLEGNLAVASVMGTLALFSLGLLTWYMRSTENVTHSY